MYIPLFELKQEDNIFDGCGYLKNAMKENLPYTETKMTDPVEFILKVSLPKRHIKKNSYNYVLKFYKQHKIVRHLLDSCIVNSIVGLYPNIENNNHEIFNSIKSILLLLKFYNSFVFNPNRVNFIETLCQNQIYLKWIIRQFVIFTIMNDISISDCWESDTELNNKLSLNFPNFVECNTKNINNYRRFYYLDERIERFYETTKKKKESDLDKKILNELKTSIQNDFIINSLFEMPIREYVKKIPNKTYKKFHILCSFDDVPYSKRLEYCGLSHEDCKIINEIETQPKNTKIKNIIEKLSIDGKFLCYNFFNYLTKYKKIKIYDLNPFEKLKQIVINALIPNYFEDVVYTLCCNYPRICNRSGNQNANKNESGLNEVSVGINNQLFCSKHYRKKLERDNELILKNLKRDTIFELKKLFKYIKNRRLTFQLYQYIYTGRVKVPNWFDNEYDDELCDPDMLKKLEEEDELSNSEMSKKLEEDSVMPDKDVKETFALVKFVDHVNARIEDFKKIAPDSGYLEPKNFSFPITDDKSEVKAILIKVIINGKLQIKTILNKRLKHILKEVVVDTRTLKTDLIGKFIVVETKKKSKKKNKKTKKGKKNNFFYRVFRLCIWCTEPKLYNYNCWNVNEYMCEECSGTERITKKKRTLYICLGNYIPIKII